MTKIHLRDLFRYVNGEWLATAEIPADRASTGTFYDLRDQAEADVHEIVSNDSGLAGTLYRSFMEDRGSDLSPELEFLNVDTIEEFVGSLAKLHQMGVPGPFSMYVTKDSQGDNNVVYFLQSGLGLPDEAYYREEQHAAVLEAYRKHVAEAGFDADRIVALETEIAHRHIDVVTARDALKSYNPRKHADLPELVQRFIDVDVIDCNPSYTDSVVELMTNERLDDWKELTRWHIHRSRAPYMSDEIAEKHFNFYGTTLFGIPEQRPRWKRAVSFAEQFAGDDIGRKFVAAHFPPESKAQMEELVDHLIEAYRQRITNLPWMTETTRKKALAKLDTFQAKIGYPEVWRSYTGTYGASLLDNLREGNLENYRYNMDKVGKLADRAEWVTTPQTVNAFYNPVVNDITFPAAILRAPFFDPAADFATNLGAIGAVIGHEIGHGFDDQGSQYDGEGNLNSWWTEEDRAAFERLTEKLVAQFEGLQPEGVTEGGVNGKFTLGENIGDLGGLGIAVMAAKRAGIEDLTDLFFSWARIWRAKHRADYSKQLLAIDPHSPAEFRCNVIAANIDELYDTFDVDRGSMMWLDPADRVTIW